MIPDALIYTFTAAASALIGSVFAPKKQRIAFMDDVQAQELAKQMLATDERRTALASLLAERGIDNSSILDHPMAKAGAARP